MPLANSKPPLNQIVDITLIHRGRKPGKWDGANWWIEYQVGEPMVPIKDTFVKEWREIV